MDAKTPYTVEEKPNDPTGLSDVDALPNLSRDSDADSDKHITPEGTKIKAPLIDIPMKYRIGAFAFIVFFSTGPAFAEYTLGPLKSTIRRELNVNSEWFFDNQRERARGEANLWEVVGVLNTELVADDRCPVQHDQYGRQPGQHHPAHYRRYRNGLLRCGIVSGHIFPFLRSG